MQLIRTLSLIPIQIKITYDNIMPLYKKLAPKIRELKMMGMNNKEIAVVLKISRKTTRKSLII